MIRAISIVAVAALAAPGCGFAVKHPAITAGIVGGTMGLSTCELASSEHGTCFMVGGGAAALLGLVAATALWLGESGEDSVLQPEIQDVPLPPVERPSRPDPAARAAPAAPAAPQPVPDYLKQPPTLAADATAEDRTTAAAYASSTARGPLIDGARLTILTARTTYRRGDEVRVIHVLEAPGPGVKLHVMGPKPIHGEYVDGVERTPPSPGAAPYDGRVLDSPGADFHYAVTTYRFDAAGPHRIQWRDGGRESNVLEIRVE